MNIPKEIVEKYIELNQKQFNENINHNQAELRIKQLVQFYVLLSRKIKTNLDVNDSSSVH